MKYEILNKQDNQIVFKIVFTSEEFERELVKAYRKFAANKPAGPDEYFLTLNALFERHPKNRDILNEAVFALFGSAYETISIKEKFPSDTNPVFHDVTGDIGAELHIVASIDVPPALGNVDFKNIEIHYSQIVSDGNEITKRINDAKEYYGSANEEELAKRLGAYDNAADMVSKMQASLDEQIANLNREAKRKAAKKQLLVLNPFELDVKYIETYVDQTIENMKNQVGEDVFRDTFGESNESLQRLRDLIKKEDANEPYYDIILNKIAFEIRAVPTDKYRLEEIEAQRAQATDQSAIKEAADILPEIKKDPLALHFLDDKVKRAIALDYVIDHARWVVDGEVPVTEAAPQFSRYF